MTPFQGFLIRFAAWGLAALVLLWLVVGNLTDAPQATGSHVLLVLLVVVVAFLVMIWGKWLRERFVRDSALPVFLKRKLQSAYPGLSSKDYDLVERGLSQFFFACVRSGNKLVAMPSRLVEGLWREFAQNGAAYGRWCDAAYGYLMVPTAALALGRNANNNDALRRTCYLACKEESIKPKRPTRLPILFALDAKLCMPGGIVYEVGSMSPARIQPLDKSGGSGGEVYFGCSFSSDDYSGKHDDFGGADSSSSSDGGGGGGDGGGGGGGD